MISRRVALAALTIGLVSVACGGSGGATSAPVPTAPPVATPVAGTPVPTPGGSASASCPSGATVGAALGITLPDPVSVPGGTASLPSGAKGVACEYHTTSLNVLIELITNTDPASISTFSANFPVPYVSVPGVGDQARSFMQSLNNGSDNEGVVATKGSTLVAVSATATPASLAQIEALVNQLL